MQAQKESRFNVYPQWGGLRTYPPDITSLNVCAVLRREYGSPEAQVAQWRSSISNVAKVVQTRGTLPGPVRSVLSCKQLERCVHSTKMPYATHIRDQQRANQTHSRPKPVPAERARSSSSQQAHARITIDDSAILSARDSRNLYTRRVFWQESSMDLGQAARAIWKKTPICRPDFGKHCAVRRSRCELWGIKRRYSL